MNNAIRAIWMWATILLLGGLGLKHAQAQPIVPAPDGVGTIVTPDGDRFNITGGQLSSDQTNLFHSLFRFGLSQQQIANFVSNSSIHNILVRVVGGEASHINGLIQVTGGQSNLYLMNPAGIVFGSNARLNVPASFTATTANGIGFGSQWFSASGANNYADLVGTPHSFAFTMEQPGAILNFGTLTAGKNLNLLGGTILSTGQLNAPNGQIVVVSIPGENMVRLSQPGSLLSLDIQTSAFSSTQPNTWHLPVLSLPALLTGGNTGNANTIQVNENGSIQLLGSGISLAPGDIVLQSIKVQPGSLSIRAGEAIFTVDALEKLGFPMMAMHMPMKASIAFAGLPILHGSEHNLESGNLVITQFQPKSFLPSSDWMSITSFDSAIPIKSATNFLEPPTRPSPPVQIHAGLEDPKNYPISSPEPQGTGLVLPLPINIPELFPRPNPPVGIPNLPDINNPKFHIIESKNISQFIKVLSELDVDSTTFSPSKNSFNFFRSPAFESDTFIVYINKTMTNIDSKNF